MKFIEIKNCSKVYKNGVTAIADLNLEIKKGEFVFVIGATASGKSTLIKMLYREEKPTRGEVFVGGINVSKLRNGKVYKLRRKLGVVFQDFKLLPKLNVYENVAFGLEAIGMKSSEIMDVINDINKDLGTTVVMATHDKDIVNRMKKRVITIENGVKVSDVEKGSYKVHENN